MWIAIYTVGTVAATAIIWFGSGMLESAGEKLSAFYELPNIVQGAIVVAVGSSFPELSTTVISALFHDEFELGVAAIVGSALFNIVVIPGLAGLATEDELESDRDLVYKEAQFYMVAISVLLLTFSFAVIYNPVDVSGGPAHFGELDRPLALIPVALYGLYLFVQYQDTMDFEAESEPREIRPLKQWALLVASLLIVLVGVEIIVRSAVGLGEILDTPSFFWGITVVAAGTSIPDVFVSLRAARGGRAVTSMANVLGSNVFDLLVAIPAGVLIAGSAVINFSLAVPMMSVLTLATVLLFAFLRTQLALDRFESGVLLAVYLFFVVWMGLESFGITSVLIVPPPTG
jgi:cation:H+ antiporter